jgi:hypothetical protein
MGSCPSSFGNHSYYGSFIDDFSKFTWIYLLKHKSEVFDKFRSFQAHVEHLFNCKILAMQTYWGQGGEYQKLSSFFDRFGITHLVSCPHTHQQNGTTERKHRHIVEVCLALLANVSMPLKFWDEAFQTTAFLINRFPTLVLNHDSPIEKLFDTKAAYSFIRTFGCACWPHLRPYTSHKLSFRSKQCVFL